MSLKERRNKERLAKKVREGFRGYPIATVAYYGPDATRATKVSVGLIEGEGIEVGVLERWFSSSADVRADPQIAEAILSFIQSHAARTVASAGRIIGCPHEEGVDYPEGEECPQCPFWAGRDRWNGGSSAE